MVTTTLTLMALSLLAGPAPEGVQPEQPADPGASLLAPPEPIDPTRDPRAPELRRFAIRDGYEVTLAVAFIPDARFMCFDPDGALYVSRPLRGDVLRLTDEDNDGEYESRTVFARGYPTVQAIQFHDGELWMATSGSVHRAKDTDADGVADEVVDVLAVGSIPRDGLNAERALLVTDTGFYTCIGDGSNISDQSTTQRQAIWKYALDASRKSRFSGGIRDTVELRLRPGTIEVWGFDRGSIGVGWSFGEEPGGLDPIGSVNPPDEMNWYRPQKFYGHPQVYGMRVPHPQFVGDEDINRKLAESEPPQQLMPARSGVSGFDFIPAELAGEGHGMPADHAGDAFVAMYGQDALPGFPPSRSGAGFGVARVLFDDTSPYGVLPIVRTLGEGGVVLARPVDVVTAPDGSVLFSSDAPTGRVYRLRWVGTGTK